ncbi:Nanos-type domain-containing protein [Caenorhabditis elegans]|uniref:Nanos-type domain-containing protein n=1 Tax=Caenorhabditis elegans TaxID=6239 RepID=Q9XTR4_CAEEL|nr:Nanos-type domain-containing protein [Caenorhabditis elegans]CAB16550.2 Nanos-type domain-containing protein [Caenorhabditis elegans]|eukprot:NP_001352244.1 Uncharacterized protein CELE_ZK262.9 [Caenorhabditis elegans]
MNREKAASVETIRPTPANSIVKAPPVPLKKEEKPVQSSAKVPTMGRFCIFCKTTTHESIECNSHKESTQRVRCARRNGYCDLCLLSYVISEDGHHKGCTGLNVTCKYCLARPDFAYDAEHNEVFCAVRFKNTQKGKKDGANSTRGSAEPAAPEQPHKKRRKRKATRDDKEESAQSTSGTPSNKIDWAVSGDGKSEKAEQ